MPNPFQRFRHRLDNPPSSDDMPQLANHCPKCESGNPDDAASCARCGHDLATPFNISAEQYRAAVNLDGSCVSCRSRHGLLSALTWKDCGKCGAPHCRTCWKLTYVLYRPMFNPNHVSR